MGRASVISVRRLRVARRQMALQSPSASGRPAGNGGFLHETPQPTRLLIIVQNLPVPFDRRVWLECQALISAGYQVAVVCPKGSGEPAYEVRARATRPRMAKALPPWPALAAELQVRGAHRLGRAGPGVPAGRRPGAVAVLAHLHRHRDDEGARGQPVHGRQGAGPAGPGAQGAGHGGPAGRDGHLQEGDEQARLLHPAGLLAVRRGRRGGRGGRGVQGRPAGRGGRQRVRPARRVQLDPGQPVRRGAAGRGPRARRVRHRGRHRHAGRAPRRAAARRDLPGHRPRPDRSAGGPAAGRGRDPGGRSGHDRGPLPAGRAGGRGAVRGPG